MTACRLTSDRDDVGEICQVVQTKHSPRVSVICTARNAGDTIKYMLLSVRHQSMSDWELVVVDDGSSDETAAIARSFADEDPRIRLVSTSGIGRGKALNLAVQHSRSDIIANLDADDEAHPARLEFQWATFNGAVSAGVLASSFIAVRGKERARWRSLRATNITPSLTNVTRLLAFRNPVLHSSVMMRRATLIAAGGYAEHIESQFDYDLWVRLASLGVQIRRLELDLVAKRLHRGQYFRGLRRWTYVRNSVRIQRRAIRLLGLSPWEPLILGSRICLSVLPGTARRALRRRLEAYIT